MLTGTKKKTTVAFMTMIWHIYLCQNITHKNVQSKGKAVPELKNDASKAK